DDDGLWLDASHDCYRRLKGRPLHRRCWRLQAGCLRIEDAIDGGFESAVARFRIAPDLRVDGDRVRAKNEDVLHWRIEPPSALTRIDVSTYHPEFGLSQACEVIEAALEPTGRSVATFRWDG
ncbi:MAG: heparinase II/III family protein, partial [Lysobacter sp.]|nr:heparinase II/III family protein [Lysobacter sp.]